jgi:hypothetical protein
LLLKKIQSRLKLVVNQAELRFVTFWVNFHFGLERLKAQLLRAPPRRRQGIRHRQF